MSNVRKKICCVSGVYRGVGFFESRSICDERKVK